MRVAGVAAVISWMAPYYTMAKMLEAVGIDVLALLRDMVARLWERYWMAAWSWTAAAIAGLPALWATVWAAAYSWILDLATAFAAPV